MDSREAFQAWATGAEESLFHMPAGGEHGGSHSDAMPILANGMVQVYPGNRAAN
jgi:hypothetical protein